MQGPESEEYVAGENAHHRAPTPHEFRLQNAAVDQFLMETPDKVYHNCNRRWTPPCARVGYDHSQSAGEEKAEDNVRDYEDLNEVRLLGHIPIPPAIQTDLRQPHSGKEPDQDYGQNKQDRHAQPRRRQSQSAEAEDPQPGTDHAFKQDEEQQQPKARRRIDFRRTLVLEKEDVALQMADQPLAPSSRFHVVLHCKRNEKEISYRSRRRAEM